MTTRMKILAVSLSVALVAGWFVPGCGRDAPPHAVTGATKAYPRKGRPPEAVPPTHRPPTIRFATFNVSFYRNRSGQLSTDLADRRNEQARQVAEILQRVRPDVVLLNEFDYDPAGLAVRRFQNHYLAVGQNGAAPLRLSHVFFAPVNTGVDTGRDLDRDGRTGGPGDAYGYGKYPGQYGMVVLSRYPIDRDNVRTFQRLLWKDMPGALWPVVPKTAGEMYYPANVRAVFRLSSKSHWDIPLRTPAGVVHVLAAHPTPPVFDGPEDRNGRRNHDEIRLWADYLSPRRAGYLYDDRGHKGGLADGAHFVLLGDYNADPVRGDGVPGAMDQILLHPRVRGNLAPVSEGAAASDNALSATRRNTRPPNAAGETLPAEKRPGGYDPARHTCEIPHRRNLRLDYALPSRTLTVRGTGVFWPAPGQPHANLVRCSDHRLVWVDVVGPTKHR